MGYYFQVMLSVEIVIWYQHLSVDVESKSFSMAEKLLVLILFSFLQEIGLTNGSEARSTHYRSKRSPYHIGKRLYDIDTCNNSETVSLHRRHAYSLTLLTWPYKWPDQDQAAQLGTCQLAVQATSKPRLGYNFYGPETNLSSCDVKLNIYGSAGFSVGEIQKFFYHYFTHHDHKLSLSFSLILWSSLWYCQ